MYHRPTSNGHFFSRELLIFSYNFLFFPAFIARLTNCERTSFLFLDSKLVALKKELLNHTVGYC